MQHFAGAILIDYYGGCHGIFGKYSLVFGDVD